MDLIGRRGTSDSSGCCGSNGKVGCHRAGSRRRLGGAWVTRPHGAPIAVDAVNTARSVIRFGQTGCRSDGPVQRWGRVSMCVLIILGEIR